MKSEDSSRDREEEWTKEEMQVYQHGELALCAAVLKQWRQDGSPVNCDIEAWKDMFIKIYEVVV